MRTAKIEVPDAGTYDPLRIAKCRQVMTQTLENLVSLTDADAHCDKFASCTTIKYSAQGRRNEKVQFENFNYGIRVTSPWIGTVWLGRMPLKDAIHEVGMLTVKAFESGDWAVKYAILRPGFTNVAFETVIGEPYLLIKNPYGCRATNIIVGLPDETIKNITYASILADGQGTPSVKILDIVNGWLRAARYNSDEEPLTDSTDMEIGGIKIKNILIDLPSNCDKMTVNGESLEVMPGTKLTVHNRRPASSEMAEIAQMLLNACKDVVGLSEQEDSGEEELLL